MKSRVRLVFVRGFLGGKDTGESSGRILVVVVPNLVMHNGTYTVQAPPCGFARLNREYRYRFRKAVLY